MAADDDTVSAHGPASDEDAELIREFVQEAEQYFAAAEAALLTLERAPAHAEAIGVVFRAFHTVKGVASALGLRVVSELAHHAESFLVPVRDGTVRFEGRYPELALRAVDMLRALVGCAGSGASVSKPPAAYHGLIEQLANPTSVMNESSPCFLSRPAPGGEAARASPAPGLASHAQAERGLSLPARASARARAASRQASNEDAWIRIRAARLDSLLDMVGELVIAQATLTEDPCLGDSRSGELSGKVHQCAEIVRELHELILSLRMVPLRATFQKMGRVVRDTARRCHKRAELRFVGDDTEIDRNLADAIVDPLVHMVRNAIDHGIESPAERRAAGKSEVGALELRAHHAGEEVVIELADDGRGMIRDRIVAKARQQGLLAPDARLADAEILSLIFSPGFSTSDTVTDISGRGVGMDVVKRAIESASGRIEISSAEGRGTTFAIHLPLTLALTDGMLVKVGAQRYVIPSAQVQTSFRPEPAQLEVSRRGEMVMLAGTAIPLLRVHAALGVQGAQQDPALGVIVVVGSGGGARALLVDDLLGKYQLITKSLGPAVGKLAGISGGTILGDGHIGLIIDPPGLIRWHERRGDASVPSAGPEEYRALRRAPFSASELCGKHLTFTLGGEQYALPLADVREVAPLPRVTELPHAPPHLRGVCNLRGRILPLIDLPLELRMPCLPPSDQTRVIVVSSRLGHIGLMVDRVSEAQHVAANAIDPSSDLGALASAV